MSQFDNIKKTSKYDKKDKVMENKKYKKIT